MKQAIGIFDSGYGGLTVMKEIVAELPRYDYLYLGDNARAPYGTRSFDTIYQYTLECVEYLFKQGCPLIILACNTASAKALRSIQQRNLPNIDPKKRVLGVIRPTAEVIGDYSKSNEVGILGTPGTISSRSYILEINNFFPKIKVHQEACPMWVPLVEHNEVESEGAAYFVQQHIEHLFSSAPNIDTLLLGCTHYPLLLDTIKKFVPKKTTIISQGEIVAKSLTDYLKRHPEMNKRLSKKGRRHFHTTGSSKHFNEQGSLFYGEQIISKPVFVD